MCIHVVYFSVTHSLAINESSFWSSGNIMRIFHAVLGTKPRTLWAYTITLSLNYILISLVGNIWHHQVTQTPWVYGMQAAGTFSPRWGTLHTTVSLAVQCWSCWSVLEVLVMMPFSETIFSSSGSRVVETVGLTGQSASAWLSVATCMWWCSEGLSDG